MIDGLSANLPGPYGNTTVETPTLNRFAAESALFDFCFSESPMLSESYPRLLKNLVGEGSTMVSDCPEVLKFAQEYSFERIVDATGPQRSQLANDIAETQTASFFIHAIEALQSLDSDGLCWLHHTGLNGAWDAPWEYRSAFMDEDDPEPPKDVARPVGTFDPNEDDPDVLLGYQQSAYAQLVVFDQLFGVFLDQLRHSGILDKISIVFGSPRGYPLGEHGVVGQYNNLYNETLHVPLMIRHARDSNSTEDTRFGARHQGMVQLSQLNEMVSAMVDGGFHSVPFCDAAISTVDRFQSLHDGDWKLIRDRDAPDAAELYAKPDDRWDVNNVSRRCADVVENLSAKLVAETQV